MVVDTNLLVVANNRRIHPGSPKCVITCVKALLEIEQNGFLCLDDKMRIFDQYRRYACFSGQPSMGDRFFKWAFNNQANENLCERVVINQRATDEYDLHEFPDDPDLVRFDRSDRVFIAVALTSSRSPKILQATDTRWQPHQSALEKHGVEIEFLCPDAFKPR